MGGVIVGFPSKSSKLLSALQFGVSNMGFIFLKKILGKKKRQIQNSWKHSLPSWLVGGFNPFEKYARQIGNLLQIGVHIKKIFETTTYPAWN